MKVGIKVHEKNSLDKNYVQSAMQLCGIGKLGQQYCSRHWAWTSPFLSGNI